MKRLLVLLLALALCLGLAACGGGEASNTGGDAETPAAGGEANGGGDDAPQAGDGEVKRVAFICKAYSDMFCLSVMEEFQNMAPAYADQFTVEYFDAEMDATKQNNLIETCVASGFDAIVFQQVDAEASVNVVKDALEKGVIVCVTTGHIEDGGASWFVDADPFQQGEAAVVYAIDNGYCDDAKIAILRGPAGNFHADERLAAFEQYLNAKDDAEIASSEIADWSKDRAMTITQNWLVSIPDLDVIFASCDDMALGAIEAIQMAGKQDQVSVFSIDGSEAGIAAVKDGSLVVTVQQDAKGYAGEALEIVAKLLRGEEAKSMNIDSTLISPENVDEFIS